MQAAPAWARIRELERIIVASGGSQAAATRVTRFTLATRIRVFVSHSSAGEATASMFADLIRDALGLFREQIRCTSTTGYKLPAGVKIDDYLWREIHETDVLLGLISSNSVKSLYVAFELGARWAPEKPFFPVLLPGTPSSVITGPLQNLNVLNAAVRGDLFQLVEDLAAVLGVEQTLPTTFIRCIDRIVEANRTVTMGALTDEADAERPRFSSSVWRDTEGRFRSVRGEADALWKRYRVTGRVVWSVYPRPEARGTAHPPCNRSTSNSASSSLMGS